jgi:nucleoside 2-deoxyribosyltransferase
VSDWLEDLDPDERADWESFVEHVRRDAVQKMSDSAFVASLVPDGEVDVKFAVELGLSIMLDKPILAIVTPGAKIPERMRRVADEIVEADVDVEEGRRAVMEAMERMQERLP